MSAKPSAEPKKGGRSKAAREWALIAAFVVFDLVLLVAGIRYLRGRGHAHGTNPIEAMGAASSASEAQAMADLEKIGQSGSWESLERARAERAQAFLASGVRPTLNAAVYFFPETLPDRAFEQDFVRAELKPGLEALRQAYDSRRDADAALAYRNLETRVENYELGTSQEASGEAAERLSEEARRFLSVYRPFTTFK